MTQSQILEINDASFTETVITSAVPVLVDFTAAWCPPCRALTPHLEGVAKSFAGRLKVVKCDTDENPELAARFDIRGLPTLLLFKGGKVAGQIVGAVPRARIEALVQGAISSAAA